MPRTPRVGSIPPYGIKAPVKASTTGNITLSGEQTIDSVSVVAGDRVLVRNQTDTTENGIYNVKNGAWERATDANDADDIVNGTMVLDANSGVVYQLDFSGDFDPGTTTVTVSESSSAFASAAAQSATDAEAAQSAAETAETNAVAAKNAAETARTGAETAESNIDGRLPDPSAGDAGKLAVVDSSEDAYDPVALAATASGTDTLTATLGWTVYHSNHVFALKAASTNTSAVTLNLDSLGAKNVTLSDGTALPAGSLEAGKVYSLWYDGSKFIVQNPSVSQAVAEAGTQGEGVMTPERAEQHLAERAPLYALSAPSSSDSSVPPFGTWVTPSPDRTALVLIQGLVETDGTTTSIMEVDVDETGDGSSYDLQIASAPSELGAGATLVRTITILVPAGGSFRLSNIEDPNGANFIDEVREFLL